MAKISILGSGVVGGIIGRGLRDLGNEVIFYDVDEEKIRGLQDSGLPATTNLARAIGQTDFSFLCVPTPTKDRKIDLSHIESVARDLGSSLKSKEEYHIVVVKSTVVPTTTQKVIIPLLEKNSGKRAGPDMGICVNPEFLTEIHSSWSDEDSFARDFFTEERIVIGELDERSGDALQALYKPLRIPIIRTDLKTAEMIKYACNCALASRISYWNEIYFICRKLQIDSNLVARVAAMDKRIGEYGTVHGKAFGGKCLPKDLEAFIALSEELGHEPKLLKAVQDINKEIGAEKGVRE